MDDVLRNFALVGVEVLVGDFGVVRGVPNFVVLVAAVVLLAVVLGSGSGIEGQGKWSVVGNHLATILMGVSFTSDTTGWVAGAANGAGPVILYTSNGGSSWVNQNHASDALAFMSLDMYSSTVGLASGLGVGKLIGSAYTTNGKNWSESTNKHLDQEIQSVGFTSATDAWQVGTWGKVGDLKGDGVLMSSDGGNTFKPHDWDQISYARYGSFVDSETGFVAGGQFPSNNDSQRHLTQHLSIDGGILDVHPVKHHEGAVNDTYAAVIAYTKTGGKTWSELYSNKGTAKTGFYFNGINFVSATQGWVVGEGINATNDTPYSFIWGTTDAGSTWTQQFYAEHTSLIQITMLSPTFGWACGGQYVGSLKDMKGTFYVTTDGKTWTESGAIRDTYQLNIDVVDQNTAYSVGLTILGVCSVYKYSG